MKTAIRTCFALVMLMALSHASLMAADIYWDINGTATGATSDGGGDATGDWDTTTSNWTTDGTNGTTATINWSNVAPDSTNNAIFAAGTNATGTYTVNIAEDITVAKITVQEGGVTFSGPNTITFSDNGAAGNAAIDIASGRTVITSDIGGVVRAGVGSSGLYKGGAGTLDISAVSSFLPHTAIVQDGVLDIGSAAGTIAGKALIVRGSDTSGVFQMSGTYNKSVGTGTGKIRWVSGFGGGFAARGGNLVVQLNGGSGTLTFGGTDFISSGHALVFGSNTSDGVVQFYNGLDLAGSSQTIHVNDNPLSNGDRAAVLGAINNGNLIKTGPGLLTLFADNDTGGTPLVNVTIGEGTLGIGTGGSSGTLGTGLVTNNGSLHFLRDNITVNNLIAGTGEVVQRNTNPSPNTLTTFTNANTYTGDTIVSGGTLRLGNNERIADVSDLVLSGGTFATGGFSETLGTLDLNADSILDFGSGSSILSFADSSSLGWIGTLTIDNWSGSPSGSGLDQLLVGTNSSGLTGTQLSSIHFTGYDPGAAILLNGEVVPLIVTVPEVGSVALLVCGAILLGAVAAGRRKPQERPRKENR